MPENCAAATGHNNLAVIIIVELFFRSVQLISIVSRLSTLALYGWIIGTGVFSEQWKLNNILFKCL